MVSTDSHDCEGMWMRVEVGETVMVRGRKIMWLSGSPASVLTRSGFKRISYEGTARTITGEVRRIGKDGKCIMWDNAETWKLIRKHDKSHVLVPDSHRIPQWQRIKQSRTPVAVLTECLKAARVDVDASSLTPYLHLHISQLGLTSSQWFTARALMSKYFGQEFPIQMFLELKTIGDLVSYIGGYMNAVD
mmetsp:Transcript_48624/g.75707  ORF Transcript_48624/g.75707 Transcript_48624/m.75707 type:complete len:190 (+) Transcript_48624:2-571(+)